MGYSFSGGSGGGGGGGPGSDTTAIHDNVAGEIGGISAKLAPVAADQLVIEDSEGAEAKKRISIGTLPGSATTFTALTDTPASFTADQLVAANSAGTALEYVTKGSVGVNASNYKFVDGGYTGSLASIGSFSAPYTTIQAAVDDITLNESPALDNVWNIIINSGEYPENVLIRRSCINLVSFAGALAVATGGSSSPVIKPISGVALAYTQATTASWAAFLVASGADGIDPSSNYTGLVADPATTGSFFVNEALGITAAEPTTGSAGNNTALMVVGVGSNTLMNGVRFGDGYIQGNIRCFNAAGLMFKHTNLVAGSTYLHNCGDNEFYSVIAKSTPFHTLEHKWTDSYDKPLLTSIIRKTRIYNSAVEAVTILGDAVVSGATAEAVIHGSTIAGPLTLSGYSNTTLKNTQVTGDLVVNVSSSITMEESGIVGDATFASAASTSTITAGGIAGTLTDPGGVLTATTAVIAGEYLNVVVDKLKESSGPTDLTVGTVTDGQFLKRSGTGIISAAVWTVATEITATRTAAAGEFILVNAATCIITLPAPSADARVSVKVITGTITNIQIRTSGAGVDIDGTDYSSTGLALTNQYEQVNVISDGTDWWIY